MEEDALEKRKKEFISKISKIFSESTPETKTETSDILEQRKKKAINFLKKTNWIYILFLLPVLWLGWFVRTRNVPLLQGKYLLGLDPYFFYRYAKIILERGALPVIDYMRYSPLGYPTARFSFFSYTLVYLYKFFHFFNPSMTQLEWHIIYPPVITIISFVVFFLFVREIFDSKVALVSTAFLAVIPAYIYRTGAGFADHEAMAMLWMFSSLWVFALMWKSNNLKKSILFGSLSGLFAGAMAATWGGSQILIISVSIFVLSSTLLTKIKKKDTFSFTAWYFTYGFFAGLLGTLTISAEFFTRFDGLFLLFSLIMLGAIAFSKKFEEKLTKLTKYIPAPLLILLIIGGALFCIAIATGMFNLHWVYTELTTKGINRFRTTVSESQQPYFLGGSGWWASFEWSFILLFLGSVFLNYKMFEKSKKISIMLSSAFGAALFFFILGRYKPSSSSVIQFFSKTYLWWFFGYFALLFILYIYLYNKDKNKFENIFSTNWHYLLIFSWLLVATLMSRTQLRLLFMLAPIAAITIGYFTVEASQILYKNKNKSVQMLAFILILFSCFAFYTNAVSAYNANKFSGSGYPGQWEDAMTWIKDNTAENAVIAHWWDYGYWTQTMGNRTTVGDGGNNRGWDHGLGRYIMTSTNLTETLEYAKIHKVTHILYSKEEIPKYHAFSLIGSDENLDRESTIGIFTLQNQQEVRDGTRYLYQGTWPFDKDYLVGNLVLPKDSAYIIGFSYVDNNGEILEPKSYVFYNGQQYELNVSCVYANGKKLEFETMNSLNGCITLIPYFQNDQQGIKNAGILWTSEKVKDGLFAKLYIFNETVPYFKEVYNDGTPLGLYKGNLIGPIRIWEVEYPEGVQTDEKYLERSKYG